MFECVIVFCMKHDHDNDSQLETTKERQKRVVKLPNYLTDNYVMNNKDVDDNDDFIYMNID